MSKKLSPAVLNMMDLAVPASNMFKSLALATNDLVSRTTLMDSVYGTWREYKIDHECGYPIDITPQLYKQFYLREGIAARVVSIFPDGCWAKKPELSDDQDDTVDTDFELAVERLERQHKLMSYLHRIDELSGIGRFGILLLGIDDGKDLDEPLDDVNEWGRGPGYDTPQRRLLYMRPFDESLVLINQFEVDPNSPRYGKPLYYSVNFIDATQWGTVSPIGAETLTMRRIHWSRVIHVAEHTSSSEIFGLPRMQKVFNRLYDLKKICGGSAEMFWKGGFPGLSLEVNPDQTDVELDKAAVDKEMTAYFTGLRRYLALTGVSAKSLAPQIADPTAHYNMQVGHIATSIKCPLRIFTGTEQGVLAGSQDAIAWGTRCEFRRENHVEPNVIRQTMDRLIAVGVVPRPQRQSNGKTRVIEDDEHDYKVLWKPLTTPDEQTQAQITLSKTQALSAYIGGGVDNLIPPVEYFTKIFGMSKEEAQSVVDSAEEFLGMSLDDVASQKMDQQLNPPEDQLAQEAQAFDQEERDQRFQFEQAKHQDDTAARKAEAKVKSKTKPPAKKKAKFGRNEAKVSKKDVVTMNKVAQEALTNRTCAVIEAIARVDRGEQWDVDFLKSKPALNSRDAVAKHIHVIENGLGTAKSFAHLITLHSKAARSLRVAGMPTAARWHQGRAADLEDKVVKLNEGNNDFGSPYRGNYTAPTKDKTTGKRLVDWEEDSKQKLKQSLKHQNEKDRKSPFLKARYKKTEAKNV